MIPSRALNPFNTHAGVRVEHSESEHRTRCYFYSGSSQEPFALTSMSAQRVTSGAQETFAYGGCLGCR
jgi:hypothetical protein